MSFAAIWIDLDVSILSEHTKRQISYITYMRNLKCDLNELICEKETHRHTEQTRGCRGEGKWEGWSGSLGCYMQMHMQIIIYRMDKQQGPTV